MRDVSPRTRIEYEAVLRRASSGVGGRKGLAGLGAALDYETIKTWSKSQIGVLRAALSEKFLDAHGVTSRADLNPEELEALRQYLRPIPRVKRRTEPYEGIPEATSEAILESLRQAPPETKRALVLLPYLLGFRAQELLALTREQCLEAVKSGRIKFVRKGGKEMTLPVRESVKALFEELLSLPEAHVRGIDVRDAKWKTVGGILSAASYITQYHLFNRLVHRMTGDASLRPHKLRHEFATRLVRRNVPLPDVQAALGHKNLSTTMLYVHGDATRLHDDLPDL